MASNAMSTPHRLARATAIRPLFAYLDEYGIRRLWLATRLGVSKRVLWGYEHGEMNLPPGFIETCCAALGVVPERFGFGANSPVRQRVDGRLTRRARSPRAA